MKLSGIYVIRNFLDGKSYIGQSIDVHGRRKEHFKALRQGQHSNPRLQHAWTKYTEGAFAFEVLEKCPPEQLNDREVHWINLLGTLRKDLGYNILPGGTSHRPQP